jgi:hypothetical protein
MENLYVFSDKPIKPITMKNIIVWLLMVSGITLMSCQKPSAYDTPETIIPDEPTPELITQSFGVTVKTDVSPMDAKSWDVSTWVYNYSTVPQTLTLTGTGASAGRNYSKTCTVAELKAGTVTFLMLAGTYNASFETPHILTSDVWALNGKNAAQLTIASKVGDVLDIKINNTGLNITGSPIVLTATLEDYLIITDIPNITNGVFATNPNGDNSYPQIVRLLKNTVGDFHYAYGKPEVFVQGSIYPICRLEWMEGTNPKTVNTTSFVKGNAYHILSALAPVTQITIPGMTVTEVMAN